jgi:hypothetical protein
MQKWPGIDQSFTCVTYLIVVVTVAVLLDMLVNKRQTSVHAQNS